MAGKKNENLISVKALVNLKYDNNCFKIGEDLNVRLDDIEDMSTKGYIEVLGEVQGEVNSKEGE